MASRKNQSSSSTAQTVGLVALGAAAAGALYYLFSEKTAHNNSNRPGPSNQLHRSPRRDEDVQNGKHCSICLSDITKVHEMAYLPCAHFFHVDCISQVFENESQRLCPICRQAVSGDDVKALNKQRQLLL